LRLPEFRRLGRDERQPVRRQIVKAQYLAAALAVVAAVAFGVSSAVAGTGNGAPSGPHFNLNLIGFSNGQNVKSTTGSGGNVIFVPLYGNCQINLVEGSFSVLDNNCTDGSGALFQLPNPDPLNTGTSFYSVYAAARGKPLGSATANTCFTDTTTGTQYCSIYTLTLSRNFGTNKYDNVTKDLLYAYACVNGSVKRVPLFSDSTANWYWQYDNTGLRNASLRFYPGVQTTVPAGGQAC
jgi:hypothetical protein